MNDKTPAELTQEIMEKMKQAQQFRIIRQLPDDFEFRGASPFNISINSKGVMVFTVYATSLQEANTSVDKFLNPYD